MSLIVVNLLPQVVSYGIFSDNLSDAVEAGVSALQTLTMGSHDTRVFARFRRETFEMTDKLFVDLLV